MTSREPPSISPDLAGISDDQRFIAVDPASIVRDPTTIPDASRVARWLADIGRATGDERWIRAGAHLIGGHAGRPRHDDEAALAAMRELLESGRARSQLRAAQIVARTVPDGQSQDAVIARLRRKYRELHNNTEHN